TDVLTATVTATARKRCPHVSGTVCANTAGRRGCGHPRLTPARAGNLKYRSHSGRGSIQLPRATGHEGEGDEEGHLLDERVPRWGRGGSEPRARPGHPRPRAAPGRERSGAG